MKLISFNENGIESYYLSISNIEAYKLIENMAHQLNPLGGGINEYLATLESGKQIIFKIAIQPENKNGNV